jgi:AraC-like DNA-binding protein
MKRPHNTPKNEAHPATRIPDSIVEQIREVHEKEGLGSRLLAKRFGLSPTHARRIIRRAART